MKMQEQIKPVHLHFRPWKVNCIHWDRVEISFGKDKQLCHSSNPLLEHLDKSQTYCPLWSAWHITVWDFLTSEVLRFFPRRPAVESHIQGRGTSPPSSPCLLEICNIMDGCLDAKCAIVLLSTSRPFSLHHMTVHFLHFQIRYTLRRLTALKTQNLYVGPQPETDLSDTKALVLNPLFPGAETKPDPIKGGLRLTSSFTYNCLAVSLSPSLTLFQSYFLRSLSPPPKVDFDNLGEAQL